MRREILFVDDNAAFSESVKEAFKIRSIEADFADTWEQALALFRVGLHELVVADYNLPGSKYGLKLLLEIKHLRPSSKLILISGALTPDAKNLVGRTGLVDKFFTKDHSLFDQIFDEIDKALKAAAMPSDWITVANAHVLHSSINNEDIEAIDEILAMQVGSEI